MHLPVQPSTLLYPISLYLDALRWSKQTHYGQLGGVTYNKMRQARRFFYLPVKNVVYAHITQYLRSYVLSVPLNKPEGKLLIHFAQNGVKCKLGHSHLFLAKSNENVPKVKKPITTLSFPRHLICATICQFQQSFTRNKKEPKFSKLENMGQRVRWEKLSLI